MILSAALDLGTTFIKAGTLDDTKGLTGVLSIPAPRIAGKGLLRESSAEEYRKAVESILVKLDKTTPSEIPLGIASQRSTFLLWNRETGCPRTPLISWQDRRAAGWCEENRKREGDMVSRTGLLLSPHYAGPKLAILFKENSDLKKEAWEGRLLFGALETYLIWVWTHGSTHQTDFTMAARTLMADIQKGGWSEDLLSLYGVPMVILPKILPTAGQNTILPGGRRVAATVADQAGAALASMGETRDRCVVNLGTGGFVLYPTGDSPRTVPGYLTTPILGGVEGGLLYGLEGTINAIGDSVAHFPMEGLALDGEDSAPESFCLPDSAGVGSPHWLPNMNLLFSENARAFSPLEKGRLVLEGVIFRVREILEDTGGIAAASILVAGGLSRIPFLGQGLADCLDRTVEISEEKEGTLLGTASLALGLLYNRKMATKPLHPSRSGAYLISKYGRWKQWMGRI